MNVLVICKNQDDVEYMKSVMRPLPYKNVDFVVGKIVPTDKYDFAIFDGRSLPRILNPEALSGLREVDQSHVRLYEQYLTKPLEFILYFGDFFYKLDRERSPSANTKFTLAARIKELTDFLETTKTSTRSKATAPANEILSHSNAAHFEIQLNRVHLNNFRLFKAGEESLEIDFHKKLTVIIGENGAGKTSLLDATFHLLTLLVQKIRGQNPNMKHLENPADVRNGTLEAITEISVSVAASQPNTQNGSPSEEIVEYLLEWFAYLTADEGYSPDEKSDSDTFRHLDEVVQNQSSWLKENFYATEPKDINLPLVAYYPCEKADEWAATKPANGKNGRQTIFNGYDGMSNGSAFNFADFFEWFKWRENLVKQNGEDLPHEIATRAIYDMLNDDAPIFQNLRMDYANIKEGEMLIDKAEEVKNVRQLSSGEKTLISLVSDLARRLCILNPQKPNPLEGNGIVLIDEIDLHLHPRWQRKVVPQLQKTFPNIQFVVTTHSPFVLQNVPSESIFVLDDGKISDKKYHALGRDIDAVIFEAFGNEKYSTETKEARDLLKLVNECYDLIDEEKYEKAEKIYQKLLKTLPPLDTRMVEFRTALDLAKRPT